MLISVNEIHRELEKSMTEERQRCQEEARAQQDAMVREIEKLQAAISQATVQAEHAQQASQQLAQEVHFCIVMLLYRIDVNSIFLFEIKNWC